MTWEIGAKDRISVDGNKKEKAVHTGLFISAIAHIPSLILAIVYTVGYPFMTVHTWAGNTCVVVRVISLLFQGMYLGVTSSITVGGQTINYYPWSYFVVMIPALLISWLAYYLGFKNKKFTTLFNYQAPKK